MNKVYGQYPDPNKMREIGQKFIALHEDLGLRNASLDFDYSTVGRTTNRAGDQVADCGTVACHGGWGCVILNKTYGKVGGKRYYGYSHGADAIAEHIGFSATKSIARSHQLFCQWAFHNPDIWGNQRGRYMFHSEGYVAFGFDFHDRKECNLLAIGNHYLEVADRLEKALEDEDERD